MVNLFLRTVVETSIKRFYVFNGLKENYAYTIHVQIIMSSEQPFGRTVLVSPYHRSY